MSQESSPRADGSEFGSSGPSPAIESQRVDLQRRLAYLGLDDDDQERLRSMLPSFAATEGAFVDAFYEHLHSFEETRRFLSDPKLVERLRVLQRDHFRSLLEGNWTEEYVDQRVKVGRAHAHVGLSPQWFLGAHYQYVEYCVGNLTGDQQGETLEEAQRILSLIKVIFLDIGLTLDAYFEQSMGELRRALDLYWKANDELRRFAQLASHDLKTPIATVANLCDETLDEFGDEMPEGACELIRLARDRIFKTSTMIDELLESTLRAHEDETFGVVDLKELFVDSLDRLQAKLEERQIEVTLPSAFQKIRGDKARLREVFYNLLANAAKAIHKSPGRITIETESRGPQCLISIQDNGCGIPESELQRIFVPFHRVAEAHDEPGTGLGLYFAMYLVEREGGKIWAESKLGEGSRFCVLLNLST